MTPAEASEKLAADLAALFGGLTILDDEQVFCVDSIEMSADRAVLRLTMVHGAEIEISAQEGCPIRVARHASPEATPLA